MMVMTCIYANEEILFFDLTFRLRETRNAYDKSLLEIWCLLIPITGVYFIGIL